MLLLCITGLPLIFSHEIDELTGSHFEASPLRAEASPKTADELIEVSLQAYQGLVPLYLFYEGDNLWYAKLDKNVNTGEQNAVLIALDGVSGNILGVPSFGLDFMGVVYRLHVDLFAGVPGKLFLGLMGLLLLIALVSGVVLYAPFMHKLEFGMVRHNRTNTTKWLDLHNLIGIVTLAWLFVVGGTGVINTLADQIFKAWQQEQVMKLQKGDSTELLPPVINEKWDGDKSIQKIIDRAEEAAPGMQLDMLAWPGTIRATQDYSAVILTGVTPLESQLRKAILVSPVDGRVLEASARPWYVSVLQMSQPLHYGDYGALPLKIIWAILDLVSIVLLGSGIYLWLKKRG